MQIKAADDKLPMIDELAALCVRPDLDVATRGRIEAELRNVRAGAAGERDAAYEIEFDCGPSRNRMTIHDLRLEVGGRVAQIDHLIISRLMDFWVCESKHFADGVEINEHGEWTARYARQARGIASPVEQNRKHVAVLRDVFEKGLVELPRRLGMTIKPRFKSVILISNKARITRPKASAKVDGLDEVIKAEQLLKAFDRDFDARSTLVIAKVVSSSTIERVARDLVALHKPTSVDWAAKFGLSSQAPTASGAAPVSASAAPASTCDSCGRRVSQRAIEFCRSHASRFGGRILCYDCQRSVL